jgi:hypothetical protein
MNVQLATDSSAVFPIATQNNKIPSEELTIFLKTVFLSLNDSHPYPLSDADLLTFERSSFQDRVSAVKRLVLNDIQDKSFKGDLNKIVQGLCQMDGEDNMIRFAKAIKDPAMRDEALISVGTNLINSMKFGKAKQVLRMIQSEAAKDGFFEKTLEKQAQFIETSRDGDAQMAAVQDIIEYFYSRGSFEEINQLIKSIEDREWQLKVISFLLKMHRF